MKWKITLGILFLVGMAVGTIGYFTVLNPPKRNVQKEKAAFSLTADQLYNDYTEDEKQANDKYLNKVIELKGLVSENELSSQEGGFILRLEAAESLMGGISAEFGPDQASTVKSIAAGQEIRLKGICTGATTEEGGLLAELGTEIQLKDCIVVVQ